MDLEHRRRHARRVDRRKEVDLRLRALETMAAELRHAVGYLRVTSGILCLETFQLGAKIAGAFPAFASRRLFLLHLLDFDALLRKHVLEFLDAGAKSAIRRTFAVVAIARTLRLLGVRAQGQARAMT